MQENLSTSNFKMKLYNHFSALLLFSACIIAAAIFLGKVYSDAASKNKINAWSKARFEEFYASEKNSIDMVFLGSSHSYCTFDPENFDEALGIQSYQLGMPLQSPDSSYYTLVELLNYQHPKTIVMELYWGVLSEDFELKQADTFFQVLENEQLKKEYIAAVFPLNERVKYAVKPIRYQQDFFAYYNSKILNTVSYRFGLSAFPEANTDIVKGEEYYRSKGYIYCNYIMPEEEMEKSTGIDGKNWNFSEIQKNYIKKISKLCKEEEIELVFVTAPIATSTFNKSVNYDLIYNQISNLANELNVDYLDLNLINQKENLFPDSAFRDGGHLNDNGVKIADEYFIRWLIDRK